MKNNEKKLIICLENNFGLYKKINIISSGNIQEINYCLNKILKFNQLCKKNGNLAKIKKFDFRFKRKNKMYYLIFVSEYFSNSFQNLDNNKEVIKMIEKMLVVLNLFKEDNFFHCGIKPQNLMESNDKNFFKLELRYLKIKLK